MGNDVPRICAQLAVIGAVILFLRAAPFLLFGREGTKPRWVEALGRRLPPVAFALLVVYSYVCYFKARPPVEHLWGLAEFGAGAVTVALQALFRRPLLSIVSGTLAYMAFVRLC